MISSNKHYCNTAGIAVQIKKMLAERRVWNYAGHRDLDLRDYPCVKGIGDLAGEVLKAIRARLSPLPVLPPTYPEDLQQYARLLDSHGFSPSTLAFRKNGITVSGDGELTIHWSKRAIERRI